MRERLTMDSKKKKNVVKEQPQSYNYDDYANLPDGGVRYELVDGTLEALSPSATPNPSVGVARGLVSFKADLST